MQNDSTDVFRARLKLARDENSLTQAELAERADTKQSNISRFESGNYNPSVDFLQKIAGALDKKLDITLK